jgi:hypothetical protein
MRPLLIAALIILPCATQPALELTRNEVPVYRNAPDSTKYMDQSVTFPHSDWAPDLVNFCTLTRIPPDPGSLRSLMARLFIICLSCVAAPKQ